MVLEVVRRTSAQISVPMFVKIRLLDSVPETVELVRQVTLMMIEEIKE